MRKSLSASRISARAVSTPRIAAVIATCDRLSMLRDRALRSVRAQTRPPDHVVVVDDSKQSLRPDVRNLVRDADLPGKVAYLENSRSPGASGGWNTAVDFLLGAGGAPASVFVAILDDDDAWAPAYLERCAALATAERLDMVASGLRRIESQAAAPIQIDAPPALNAADFLTDNPGIQGSNLFLRLSILLAAGGFDEALPSATDRDLCIRIAESGAVRYGRLTDALVDHFADSGRARLSTRGAPTKLDGLTAFLRKYAGRMTAGQRRAFSERAATLFDWRPPRDLPPPPEMAGYACFRERLDGESKRADGPRTAPAAIAKAPARPPYRLYAGIVTSDPRTLAPLLHGLASLGSNGGVGANIQAPAVLVLDNGGPAGELDAVVRGARDAGLKIAVVDVARQCRDAAAGAFGAALRTRPRGQAGIAQARTMLQRYLGAAMAADDGSFGWILDDDMRVDARARAYLPWLPAFRDEGTDALIGAYEGAAPAPPPTELRVHLVDLLHNLHWLRNLPPRAPLPDRTVENADLRARYPDYHYDLSRKHTGHLETPCWLEPAFRGETVADAQSRLLAEAAGILSGRPFTRPLIVNVPSNPLAAAEDSVHRGGCTFILNHRALTRTPNAITRIQGREARRSDMIWAIMNRHYRRMTVKAVGFPVRHVGRGAGGPGFDVPKIRGEIVGSALYAGLTEFLSARPRHALDFSPGDMEEIRCLADLHLDRRWRALEWNFHRIAGLREAIRRLTGPRGPDGLHELFDALDRWIAPESFRRIRSGVETHDGRGLADFLASLRGVADDFAAATVNIDFISAQLGTPRNGCGGKKPVSGQG